MRGEFDNTANINRRLEVALREAQLLGYRNFAELSLATKMADSPEQVLAFCTIWPAAPSLLPKKIWLNCRLLPATLWAWPNCRLGMWLMPAKAAPGQICLQRNRSERIFSGE